MNNEQINRQNNLPVGLHDNINQVGRFRNEEYYEMFYERLKTLLIENIPTSYQNLNFHELRKITGMQQNLIRIDSNI